jgi:hypothetical protein
MGHTPMQSKELVELETLMTVADLAARLTHAAAGRGVLPSG